MSNQDVWFERVLVTPKIAARWLRQNAENNRPVKKTKVPQYVRDIKVAAEAGDGTADWSMTGETIKFSPPQTDDRPEGTLIDGQNRLQAVVESRVPVWFMVAYNVPRESMQVIDSGASRTASDAFRISGATERMRNSAIVRWLIMWDNNNPMARSAAGANPTISEIVAAYQGDAGRFDAAAKRGTDCSSRGLGNGTTAGVAFYLFHRIDDEAAHQFFDHYISGANLPDHHPTLTLRNRMMRIRVDRINRQEQLALFVRSWNAFREGRSLKQLIVVGSGTLTNDNFPRPV